MTFELVTIPCLSDNYAFLLHSGSQTALIDAPEADPIIQELDKRGWQLTEIWITHHHWDHVQGVQDIRDRFDVKVRGASADQGRLPELDFSHHDGDSFEFDGAEVQVLDVSGHTVGHIAFYVSAANTVFTADSLMALGCGRLFEGSPDQMWESLSRLAALPEETVVCSGHEYTTSNAAFAVTIEPDNPALRDRVAETAKKRSNGTFTVPSTLKTELATNPFLRAGLQSVKDALNMTNESDVAVFAEIRRRKDLF